jgi:hypothetical protein
VLAWLLRGTGWAVDCPGGVFVERGPGVAVAGAEVGAEAGVGAAAGDGREVGATDDADPGEGTAGPAGGPPAADGPIRAAGVAAAPLPTDARTPGAAPLVGDSRRPGGCLRPVAVVSAGAAGPGSTGPSPGTLSRERPGDPSNESTTTPT